MPKRVLLLGAILATACTMKLAPPPFTADQIREATQPGRTYVHRSETMGNGMDRRMLFTEATDAGCVVESVAFADDGEPMTEVATTRSSWEDLVKHASYPKDRTVITNETCEVPAGTFDCVVYTVTEDGGVTTAKFAKSLPGAPVSVTVHEGDKTIMTMELLEHRDSFSASVDINHLWDYGDPAGSRTKFEARLTEAKTSRNPGYLLELQTQIARTYSLEQKFDEAHSLLDEVESALADELPIARVRYLLERGRSFNSDKEQGRAIPLFTEAWDLARKASADGYAVDAAHMNGIAHTGDDGIEWTKKALAYAERSNQDAGTRWKGSLYNNLGWSYVDKKDYETALSYFKKCQTFFEEEGERPGRERVARWSIAKMHRLLGNIDEALAMQEKLLTETEDDGYVFEELAECLLALERKSEAQPHFAKAYEVLSKDAWLVRDEPERLERLKKLGGL